MLSINEFVKFFVYRYWNGNASQGSYLQFWLAVSTTPSALSISLRGRYIKRVTPAALNCMKAKAIKLPHTNNATVNVVSRSLAWNKTTKSVLVSQRLDPADYIISYTATTSMTLRAWLSILVLKFGRVSIHFHLNPTSHEQNRLHLTHSHASFLISYWTVWGDINIFIAAPACIDAVGRGFSALYLSPMFYHNLSVMP